MKLKAKLRRIGNSMGIILPANVITCYNVGDEITLDVITKNDDVITGTPSGLNPEPCGYTEAKKISKEVRRSVKTHPGMLRPSRVFVKTQVRPDYSKGATIDMSRHVALAPDGFPIQHTNSMKVGYVPKG